METETDDALDASDAPALRRLYDPHPAWGERSVEEVRALVEESDEVVGVRRADSGELVAAARVLTDYHACGMIYDVIVDERHRDEGLGTEVMRAVVSHPDLRDVPLSLHCREELVAFYERCGFTLHDCDVPVGGDRTVTYRTMRHEPNGDD